MSTDTLSQEHEQKHKTHSHGHHHDVTVKKVDKISATQVKLTIEFSKETILSEMTRTTQRYTQMAKLPGFRPGKAPAKMIREKYIGEIRQDVISHLVEAGMREAIEKTKLVPLNQPKIKFNDFSEEKALEFEMEFEIYPEIELKHYQGLKLKERNAAVSEEEIEKTFDNLKERFASLEPVESDKPEKGNYGVVEVSYETLEEPKKSEGPQKYTVQLGMNELMPALEKEFMEMKVGETRKVEESFPENYNEKALAGKKAVFACTLLELKKKNLPVLDDAMASEIKKGATVQSLREEIKDSIKKSKEDEIKREQRQEILDQMIEKNKFEVPASLVEDQSKSLLNWMEQDLKRQGIALSQIKKEELDSVKKRAEHMVRGSLLLKEVAVKEKITLDENRLKEKMEQIATQLNQSVEDAEKFLNAKGVLNKIKDESLTDQVFEYLVGSAK